MFANFLFTDTGISHSISVTCSHRIGGIGFLERENASILNAALQPLAARTMQSLLISLDSLGLANAQSFLTRNDGTLTPFAAAAQYPIFTFSSGVTNSLQYARRRTHLQPL